MALYLQSLRGLPIPNARGRSGLFSLPLYGEFAKALENQGLISLPF
jgi:hypothetical protein